MGPQEKRTINSYSIIDDYKCVRRDVLFTYIILCKMFFAYIFLLMIFRFTFYASFIH